MSTAHRGVLPESAPSGARRATTPPDEELRVAARNRRKVRLTTALVLGLRYLFLTRYSWILGLTLIAPAPVALVLLPGMLANFFVLDSPQQIFHVSWITLWCAAAVMETLRVTTLNAHYRFDDYRSAVRRFRQAWDRQPAEVINAWYKRADGWFCLLGALLTAGAIWYVIVDACITRTAADPAPTWTPFLQEGVTAAAVRQLGWKAALDGLFTTMLILGSVNGLVILGGEWSRRRGSRSQMLFEGFSAAAGPPPAASVPARRSRWRPWTQALHYLLGPGYFIPVSEHEDDADPPLRLAPGHMGLMLYTSVFLGWYAINYRSATGTDPMPTEASSYSALFYGLLSLLLITYLLPGFAFFLDRYRIPVFLTGVIATVAIYGTFGTDHFYELDPVPARAANGPIPTLTEVLDRWKLPEGRDGRRTLVVVHASGGGIQASAWTAQVLTGLHERYGNEFSRSVGLISAVSGGSVGTMYYLLNRADLSESYDPAGSERDVLDAESIGTIRELSRCSALEATAWGMAYPDTMRALFPPAVPATLDRGWAIERVWRQRLSGIRPGEIDRSDLRITDLCQRSRQQQFPVAVFNATLVETGQRFIIAPVTAPKLAGGEDPAAVELMHVFPHSHPRVSTAARLSATFPYVTPAARAAEPGPPGTDAERIASYHVVDGGYTDNEGAMTSVDWINRLLVHYSRDETVMQRPFDRVLVLRIQAFPKKRSTSPYRRNLLAGWTSALLGPLQAMLNVRGTSQTERGDLEIELLTQATRADIVASKERFEAEFRSAQAWADSVEQEVHSLESYLEELADEGKLTQADLARWSSASRDRLTTARSLVEQVARKRERMEQLSVSAVSFEFHPPQNDWIPFSWKLTARQKLNIDEAWCRLVEQDPTNPALAFLDDYFTRRPRSEVPVLR
jgi:hypothetical protein